MDQALYHVLLDGRKVGPYDRKTIVGMRVKHMLTSDHLLQAAGGAQLTVRELIGAPPSPPSAGAAAPGGPSRVQATYSGMLLDRSGRGMVVPRFRGELEVRVHTDVLRLAGRFRRFLRWQAGRVKLRLKDIVHARSKGPRTDLWLQPPGSARLQRIGLYLFTAEAAEELAIWLAPAGASEHPNAAAAKAAAVGEPAVSAGRVLAIAVAGIVAVVAVVLVVLLYRRF